MEIADLLCPCTPISAPVQEIVSLDVKHISCRALNCPGPGQPLTVQTIPTPDAVPGSVIASKVGAGTAKVLAGEAPALSFPTPFIPVARGIGRVAALGPDTTSLQVDQLAVLEPFIRGRDSPDVLVLWGAGVFGPSPMTKKLMKDSWRYSIYAEYTRAPLENCYALNEKNLSGNPAEGGLGYSVADLTCLSRQLEAYGGLRSIDLKAGETIIVALATGGYSGAAVEVASAMGARVIAVGRNLTTLRRVAGVNAMVNIVQRKDNVVEDLASLQQFGPIDAYIDMSPGIANDSTHVRSCLMALKPYSRASLMGIIQKDVAVP